MTRWVRKRATGWACRRAAWDWPRHWQKWSRPTRLAKRWLWKWPTAICTITRCASTEGRSTDGEVEEKDLFKNDEGEKACQVRVKETGEEARSVPEASGFREDRFEVHSLAQRPIGRPEPTLSTPVRGG